MNIKTYRQIRALVAFFVAMIVSISVVQENQVLAFVAVITGMLFMILARSKAKVVIDEREKTIREKAAQLTYAIFAPTIGIGSFLLISFGKNNLYLESLGQVLAYLTLFLISLYAISYYFLNRKFGGDGGK